MENISLDESLEILVSGIAMNSASSDQKAQGIVEEYINCVDLGEIARGIINKEIKVYDGVNLALEPTNPMKNGNGSLEVSNP